MTPTIVWDGKEAPRYYQHKTGNAVNLYDLLLHSTDEVKSADGNETTPEFAGVAAMKAESGDATTQEFHVLPDVVVDIDCASHAWEVGDGVAITGAQSVAHIDGVTFTSGDVVGYVVKREPNAVTRVRARLISTVTPN